MEQPLPKRPARYCRANSASERLLCLRLLETCGGAVQRPRRTGLLCKCRCVCDALTASEGVYR